jgi:hypothetical protein
LENLQKNVKKQSHLNVTTFQDLFAINERKRAASPINLVAGHVVGDAGCARDPKPELLVTMPCLHRKLLTSHLLLLKR